MDTVSLLQKEADGAVSEPRRILFVCTGNTCRSPMAAALLNDMSCPQERCAAQGEMTKPRFVASSAGLYANDGAPITLEAADALQAAGVTPRPDNDYFSHRARTVSAALVSEADEIVGLTASHAMQLMLRFPEAASKIRTLPLDISDPFGGDATVYRDCLARLRYAIELAYLTEASQ